MSFESSLVFLGSISLVGVLSQGQTKKFLQICVLHDFPEKNSSPDDEEIPKKFVKHFLVIYLLFLSIFSLKTALQAIFKKIACSAVFLDSKHFFN